MHIVRYVLLVFAVGTLGTHRAEAQAIAQSEACLNETPHGSDSTLIRCSGFRLNLPLAADYTLHVPGGATLLFARSESRHVIASVTLDPEPQDTPTEVYLKAQLLTVQKLSQVQDPKLAAFADTPVLTYWVQEGSFAQYHFWSARARTDRRILRLHVSTTEADAGKRKALGNSLLRMLAKDFTLVE